MFSAADVIRELGGVARGIHLQQVGFTRQALAREVDRGRITRIRNGVFSLHGIDPDVRTAVAHGGALTCASLLRDAGVWVLPAVTAPHVWVPSGRHEHAHPDCVCVVHRQRGSPLLGRVSVERALLHLRQCAGDEAFFAAFESAWRIGRIDRGARSRIRTALPRSARWLVDLARPDADSGLESLLRLRLHLLGVTLDCQMVIDGVDKVDFVLAGRLIIEADGRGNHDGASLRHKDLVRDAAASRAGYETLRFDYAQIVHDWPQVRGAVLAALRRLETR